MNQRIWTFEKQQVNWFKKCKSLLFPTFSYEDKLKLTYQPRLHRRLFGHLFAQAIAPRNNVHATLEKWGWFCSKTLLLTGPCPSQY